MPKKVLQTPWQVRLQEVVEESISKYLADFTEEAVAPAIEKLISVFPSEGGIADKVDSLLDSFEDKIDRMVDVETGKLWNDSQIQVGKENNLSEYLWVAEEDEKVCDVCGELDGQTFTVESAMDQISKEEERSFLDISDTDDMDDVSNLGFRPPAHPACRCHIEFLEEETKVEKGGPGSGNIGHEGRPGEVGGSAPGGEVSERIQRARESYKPCTREIRQEGTDNQTRLAKAIKGIETLGNKPFDVILGKNFIEVKTIVRGTNDKITMHPESLARKEKEVKEANGKAHTVVFDNRVGKIYYKEGLGSFRLKNMEEVSIKEVKGKFK